MSQYHFDPAGYEAMMAAEVPGYTRLQDRIAAEGRMEGAVGRILDVGTGTGVTAARALAAHPGATVVGIDESPAMLAAARRTLDPQRVELRTARLQDPLPGGPFDLVVSGLAVHHLDPAEKADLFVRIAGRLRPGGRFVLGDVVVPDHPGSAVTPLEEGYDRPDRVTDLLRWLAEAGLRATLAWMEDDLAVLVADRAVLVAGRAG